MHWTLDTERQSRDTDMYSALPVGANESKREYELKISTQMDMRARVTWTSWERRPNIGGPGIGRKIVIEIGNTEGAETERG